jgi:hypothetical protein
MTRPRVYTLREAADRCGVSPRTIRSWMAPAPPWRPEREPLEPIPDSWVLLGHYLFTEPALAAAELANAAGRTRRKAHRAERLVRGVGAPLADHRTR